MRTGNRKISRNRKTSGTPVDAQAPKGKRSKPGSSRKYKPQREDQASFEERRPAGELSEGNFRREKPYPRREKPDGDRKSSYGKPAGRFSKDKPRFSKEGGKPFTPREGGFKKPYNKFPKDDRAPRDGDKPFSEKPDGEKRPYTRFPKDDRAPRREGDRPFTPRSGGFKKPYSKFPKDDRAPRDGDKPFSEKPDGEKRHYTRFPKDDRAPRRDGDRPFTPRNGGFKKPYSKFPKDDRAPRDGDKPFSKKPDVEKRPYTRFPKDDRAPRRDGDRPFTPRSGGFKKPYSKFPKDDRAPRDGDKPFSENSGSERPARNFSDKRKWNKETPGSSSGDRRSSFSKPTEAGGEERKWNRKESHEFYGDRKKRPRTFNKPKFKEERKESDGTTRLNKYISNAGICSRREADDLITAGVISVNGKIITQLGFKVQPTDEVKYNDAKLKSEKPVYLLLNKPKDYITTVDDPQNRNTVMSLISNACKERVYPVGRLDRNTTGLLLFTNDGDLADKLTHPSFEVQKVYEVHLDKNLKHEHLEQVRTGITLEDGPIKPDDISYSPIAKSIIGIELHSGRNRIVRRIFEHLGYRVGKLDRVLYAGLTKKDLPRGRWRFLSELELASLKMIVGNKRFKAMPKQKVLEEE